ncbi:HAD-IIB family hydrolase [Thiocapsa marina]|uniref:HAD-superfamily hydrolase, subfamily IIB n=1 Tax=Thiocapsa marina 5811 TaxID=768671 RepID=F9UD88_9GAMM|nr:HAD-IIB family hydrolase [Thiocapsa marina]EGV17832.1 HAD-superfamily hydrolase, subfamily IIB [Thiocapsa marina 5811]
MKPLLLCTDLDRTLIPNGAEPESPDARPRFRDFVSQPEVTLAYVTGRHQGLVREAIAEYDLPVPDVVIGDVGTSIFEVTTREWTPLADWQKEIGRDWGGIGRERLAERFADLEILRLQEPEKQAPFKLSYYAPVDADSGALKSELEARLSQLGVNASLIWSIDEAADMGLLDVLPAGATKYHAVDFLMHRLGRDETTTLFAGDSGNDLEVLISPIPSVLVANGHPEVRTQALRLAAANGQADRLYCARGGWSGMNGNYSAGILEGIAHFRPDLAVEPTR